MTSLDLFQMALMLRNGAHIALLVRQNQKKKTARFTLTYLSGYLYETRIYQLRIRKLFIRMAELQRNGVYSASILSLSLNASSLTHEY